MNAPLLALALLTLLPACTRDPQETADTAPDPWTWPEGWRTDEVTVHPRLHPHLDEAGRALILDRITREPYLTLYGRIVAAADRTPIDVTDDTWLHAPSAYHNADTARAAAFLAWLHGDEAYRQVALGILLDMQDDTHEINSVDDDIHLADALVGAATAYDLLAGIGLSEADDGIIRGKLARLATSTHDVFAVEAWQLHFMGQSNHATKTVAGVWMIALVLNDHPDAYRWMAYAVTNLQYWADSMTSADGVVDEGPFYHLYSAQTHLPFYLAYDDLAGEAALPYPPTCRLRYEEDCDETVPLLVDSPLTWQTTIDQHRWGVQTRLPDGTRPPVDDSFMTPFYGGLLDDPLMRWDWLHAPAAPYFTAWTVDLSVEMLLRFDDTAPTTPPPWEPTVFLEDSGAAALRSGWEPDDTMVFVTGEHGPQRDTGHEQEDEASFSIFARGQYLAIDPSYIRYEDREAVAHTEDHNLVLVDGKGAPQSNLLGAGGVDGFVRHGLDTDVVDYVETGADYAGASLFRRVVLVGDHLVVIADTVTADRPHTYTWLLHGWGGGSDGGTATLTADGATWSRQGARLDAHVVHDGASPSLDFTPAEHGFLWNQRFTHQRLDVSADATDWHLLAALVPRYDADPAVTVTALDAGPTALAIAVDDPADPATTWVVLFSPDGSAATIVDPHPGCADLAVHGEIVVARRACSTSPDTTWSVAEGAITLGP